MKKLLFFSYGIFLLALSIFSYVFVDQNLIYLKNLYSGFQSSERTITTIVYIIFIFIFFFFYFVFLKKAQKKLIKILDLKILIGLTLLILLFSYSAFTSFDIFNYLATTKTLFFYKENPYIVMPIEFMGDPLLLFTHAANKIALYGPFWIGLTSIPYVLGLGNFLLTLFSFKLFVSLFYLGTVYLLWKMSKNLFSLTLFALNPLVVMESLSSSHNDIVMMFFALLSFFLLMKKKTIYAFIFLVFSIFIKYATIFLLPVFIYSAWKIFKKEKIDWQRVFLFSALSMFVIFFLSSLREEIYPWYAIWFLSFVALIPKKKLFLYISLAFSFGLLFRYIPFMLLGTHFGLTPTIKTIVTFTPPILISIYVYLKKSIWFKRFL